MTSPQPAPPGGVISRRQLAEIAGVAGLDLEQFREYSPVGVWPRQCLALTAPPAACITFLLAAGAILDVEHARVLFADTWFEGCPAIGAAAFSFWPGAVLEALDPDVDAWLLVDGELDTRAPR